MAISSELEHLLSEWLPRQSWFPRQQGVLGRVLASSPDVTPMSSVEVFHLDLPSGGQVYGYESVIAVGSTTPGGAEQVFRLNIPLTYRTEEELSLRSHLIGRIDDLTLGRVWVYDAAADPAYVLTMVGAIAAGRSFPGNQVNAHRVSPQAVEVDDLSSSVAVAEALSSAQVTVSDRANVTNVVIDRGLSRSVLTIFRVLNAATAAALHMPVALTKADSAAVPHVAGWMSGRWFDGYGLETCELPTLMLTSGEAEADTAWAQAVRSALEVDSGSTARFVDTAGAIGSRIGELHGDLAGIFGIVESADATSAWIKKWQERIDWAFERSPLTLEPLRGDLKRHREWLAGLDSVGGLQRIHGDLTLGNVIMASAAGPRVRNFAEGGDGQTAEPKPPAFDLVALLRSLDYAAGYARLKRTGALEADEAPLISGLSPAQLREVTDSPEFEWSNRAQNSLLTGYSRAVEGAVTLDDPILRAVLIDRLLVEVVTELRNRPAWLTVPLAALTLALRGRPPKATPRGTAAHRSGPIEPTKVTKTPRAEAPEEKQASEEAQAPAGKNVGKKADKKHEGGRAFGLDGTAAPVKKTQPAADAAGSADGASRADVADAGSEGDAAQASAWAVPGDKVSAEDFAQRAELQIPQPDEPKKKPKKSKKAKKAQEKAEAQAAEKAAETTEPQAQPEPSEPAAEPDSTAGAQADSPAEQKAEKPSGTSSDSAEAEPQPAPAGGGLGGLVIGDYTLHEEDGDYGDETEEEEQPPAQPKSARNN